MDFFLKINLPDGDLAEIRLAVRRPFYLTCLP